MKQLLRCWLLAIAAVLTTTTLIAPSRAQEAAASSVELPATDDGLPGAGPIRRYDWFKRLWSERRSAWAKQREQDQGAVVFLGDSITQGWGDRLAKAFPGLKAANRGISGDTTRGVLIRLADDVLALKPAAVVLLIGTNDLEEKAEPEVIAGNLKLILAGGDNGGVEAVWWDGAQFMERCPAGVSLDLLVTCGLNEWQGTVRPQLTVKDARLAAR